MYLTSLRKQYSRELKAAIEIAKKVGKRLMRKQSSLTSISSKENNSIVSALDVRAEKSIRSFLNKKFPEYGFIGEESESKSVDKTQSYWVVDPIDGTTNFVKGIPFFRCVHRIGEKQSAIGWSCFFPSYD